MLDERDSQNKEPDGTSHLVRCAGYRCMAYKDKQGQWRNYFSHEPLPEPVEVVERCGV